MSIMDFIKSNNDYFQDFITRSTYHSNGIEGNTLSYAETYAILWNDNSFKVKVEPRELYEVTNHKYALSYLIDAIENNEEFSENLVKKIGIAINKNIKEIDGYRKIPVGIKGAEHIPPSANQINQLMMYLVHNFKATKYKSIFEKISEFHIQFERIHPFEDGNGRTGRLLINFELLKNNLPPVVIPKVERIQYFNLIANQDTKGLSEFIETLSQKELERIKQIEPDLNLNHHKTR